MKQLTTYLPLFFLLLLGACKNAKTGSAAQLSNNALMDTVQRRTFNYFWEGAEPNSGLAPERIHMDGIYPEKDQNVITSGGSGFGIMAILSGIDRNYITREEGLARMEKIVSLHQWFAGRAGTCQSHRYPLARCRLEFLSPGQPECTLLALESRIRLGNGLPRTWLQRMSHHVPACRCLTHARRSCLRLS